MRRRITVPKVSQRQSQFWPQYTCPSPEASGKIAYEEQPSSAASAKGLCVDSSPRALSARISAKSTPAPSAIPRISSVIPGRYASMGCTQRGAFRRISAHSRPVMRLNDSR